MKHCISKTLLYFRWLEMTINRVENTNKKNKMVVKTRFNIQFILSLTCLYLLVMYVMNCESLMFAEIRRFESARMGFATFKPEILQPRQTTVWPLTMRESHISSKSAYRTRSIGIFWMFWFIGKGLKGKDPRVLSAAREKVIMAR